MPSLPPMSMWDHRSEDVRPLDDMMAHARDFMPFDEKSVLGDVPLSECPSYPLLSKVAGLALDGVIPASLLERGNELHVGFIVFPLDTPPSGSTRVPDPLTCELLYWYPAIRRIGTRSFDDKFVLFNFDFTRIRSHVIVEYLEWRVATLWQASWGVLPCGLTRFPTWDMSWVEGLVPRQNRLGGCGPCDVSELHFVFLNRRAADVYSLVNGIICMISAFICGVTPYGASIPSGGLTHAGNIYYGRDPLGESFTDLVSRARRCERDGESRLHGGCRRVLALVPHSITEHAHPVPSVISLTRPLYSPSLAKYRIDEGTRTRKDSPPFGDVIICGTPYSGKSTFASRFLNGETRLDPTSFSLVDLDDPIIKARTSGLRAEAKESGEWGPVNEAYRAYIKERRAFFEDSWVNKCRPGMDGYVLRRKSLLVLGWHPDNYPEGALIALLQHAPTDANPSRIAAHAACLEGLQKLGDPQDGWRFFDSLCGDVCCELRRLLIRSSGDPSLPVYPGTIPFC